MLHDSVRCLRGSSHFQTVAEIADSDEKDAYLKRARGDNVSLRAEILQTRRPAGGWRRKVVDARHHIPRYWFSDQRNESTIDSITRDFQDR